MSANMPGEKVKVTSLVSGREADAILLRCKSCGNGVFVALLVGDKQDLHLQCDNCGESHCAHDSECHQEEGR